VINLNKLFNIIFKDLKRDKSIYYSLIIVGIISLVFGLLFITILKDSDKQLLTNHISTFLESVNTNEYKFNITTILLENNIMAIIIWILGFSIVGIPLLIGILFYKCFTLTFTVTSLIYCYKVDGILLSFIYIFPHLIINLMFYFILIYYSFKLSLILIDEIIHKKPFNIPIKKYLIVLLISILFLTISGLYETYILPYLIKMIY